MKQRTAALTMKAPALVSLGGSLRMGWVCPLPFVGPFKDLVLPGLGERGFFWRELITEEWEWKNRNLFSEWRTSLIVQWLGYRLTLQRA